MDTADKEPLRARKAALRRVARRRREAQGDRPALSERICSTLEALPEYRCAETICSYVGVGSEVLTGGLLKAGMAGGKRVVVPYVDRRRLGLFRLADPVELEPAPFGLLEPRLELRERDARQAEAWEVDLFVVPGLAFDPSGARLGYGKGYYDDLLRLAHWESPRVGLAFACQLVRKLPVSEYDVSMHVVITESMVYRPDVPAR